MSIWALQGKGILLPHPLVQVLQKSQSSGKLGGLASPWQGEFLTVNHYTWRPQGPSFSHAIAILPK